LSRRLTNNQWYYYSIYAAGSVPEDNPTNQTPVETPTPPPPMGAVVAVHAIYEPGFVAPGMPGDEYLIGCQLPPPTFGQTYWPAAYRQATYTTSIAGGGEGTETGPAEGWVFQSIDQGTYESIQSAISDGQPDTSYSITVSSAEGGSSTTYLTWAGDATDPSGSWGYVTPATCPCTLWARGPQTYAADAAPAIVNPMNIYHLNNQNAVDLKIGLHAGHSAVLIPNASGGYTFVSYATVMMTDVKSFSTLAAAFAYAKASGYTREEYWAVNQGQAHMAILAVATFIAGQYNPLTHNCWQCVYAALQAAGANAVSVGPVPNLNFLANDAFGWADDWSRL
jgi:hypothetical protein